MRDQDLEPILKQVSTGQYKGGVGVACEGAAEAWPEPVKRASCGVLGLESPPTPGVGEAHVDPPHAPGLRPIPEEGVLQAPDGAGA